MNLLAQVGIVALAATLNAAGATPLPQDSTDPANARESCAERLGLHFFQSPNAGPGNFAAIQMGERLCVGAEVSGVAFLSLAAAGADLRVVGDLPATQDSVF